MIDITLFSTPIKFGKLIYQDGFLTPQHIIQFNKLALRLLYTNETNKLIVSVPVRFGKSFFFSTLFPAYTLITKPQTKIILCSNTLDLAMEFSSSIRALINEFGHINNVSLDKRYRRRDKFKTNFGGSFQCFGTGASIAGRGYDLGIVDDPIKNVEEANSVTQRDKIALWMNSEFLTRRLPGAKTILISSRRHPDDLSGRLLSLNEQTNDETEKWKEIKFKAIQDDGTSLWEERYPISKLLQIRNDLEIQGAGYIFESLYQNNPINSGSVEWGETLVGPHLLTKEGFNNGTKIIGIDLACGKSDLGDNSAVIVGSFRDSSNCYIGDGVVGTMDMSVLEEQVIKLISVHKPAAVVIETNGFQELVANNIYSKCVAQGINCPLIKYTAKTDKVARIKTLITPLLHKGGLKIKDCQMGRTILNEMSQFPNGKKDDTLDAIAYCIGGHNYINKITNTIYEPIRYGV